MIGGQYWVIGADGNKYGPADIGLLNHWVQEGRVVASSWIEEVSSGRRVQAGSIPSVVFPLGTQQSAPHLGPSGPTPGSPYGTSPFAPGPYQVGPGGPSPFISDPYGQNPYSSGQSPYPRYPYPTRSSGDGGVVFAWLLAVGGLFCCPVIFPLIGCMMSISGAKRGSAAYKIALIANVVSLVIGFFGLSKLGCG